MSHSLDTPYRARDSVAIPAIWVAVAVSMLIHAALLMGWMPSLQVPAPENPEQIDPRERLTVRIMPLPGPPPAAPSPPAVRTVPHRPMIRPRPAPPASGASRKPTAPPVMALRQPSPASPPVGPAVPATPAPASAGDFAAFVESRRRARNAEPDAAPAAPLIPAAPAEDEAARRNRIAMANINPQGPMAFGYDPTKSGGVFHIDSLTSDYAEFIFYGWHLPAKRKMMQRIEVMRGDNPDIRIAVVRRMIAIIRRYENGDFSWESQRLGRSVTLSARARDNTGLEEFMLREFFEGPQATR